MREFHSDFCGHGGGPGAARFALPSGGVKVGASNDHACLPRITPRVVLNLALSFFNSLVRQGGELGLLVPATSVPKTFYLRRLK